MVNGVVIAQEGAVLPGSVFTFPIESLTPQLWGYSISRDGSHWALLGSNADTQDWASLDNTVFYKTGDPIIPGDTRTFDDTSYSLGFVGASVNSLGQLALAARTSTGDDAIVLAGERVLVRAGDPVDLDANGLLDDGVYLANVAEGSVTFTDNQRLFAIVQLADSTTAIRGIAFITLDAATCNSIDFNNDALFPDTQDIADFLSVFAGGVCGGQAPADPPCNTDIDFNRDFLFPDTDDIAALLRVFAGGSCT